MVVLLHDLRFENGKAPASAEAMAKEPERVSDYVASKLLLTSKFVVVLEKRQMYCQHRGDYSANGTEESGCR